ncbi:MAG: GDSL-type esterase/lipase family protein [Oscillospiraceae bacterium]|nr:GDSL-type esterase/lipase family protein [Oscillospiraceae bacterium]
MTNLTKRILRTLVALCLIVVLCAGTLQISATSQTTITYLALGDSITAGYGLTNPDTEGFVAKFASAISDTDTSVVTVNSGLSGLTASTLATTLATGSYNTTIAAADVITLTIGGNDLMAAFYETVAGLYSDMYNTACTSTTVQLWLSDVSNNSTEVSNIVSLISTDSGKAALTAAVGAAAQTCVGNIETIVGLIRTANADAVILLANQYNPYTSLSGTAYAIVNTLFASATTSFNTLLSASTTITLNCTIVDLYSAGVSTNVDITTMNLDFHPNATGHTTIANAMAAAYVTATTPALSTDYVTVGTAELHDGYYTTDGVNAVYGTPTGTGYAYYSGGVLYLYNFSYTTTSAVSGISSTNDSLTIDLCNSSSSISTGDYGILSTGALTITNGSLTVSGISGIYASDNIVISDCTSINVTATGGDGIVASNVTISDSTVNVTVSSVYDYFIAGIGANSDVSISGSTVGVSVDGVYVFSAIWSMGGNISITDESTVTAEVSATIYSGGAISAIEDGCTVTISDSVVTASSECTSITGYTYNYGAIYASGDITITESEITASTNGGAISWYMVGAAVFSGDGSVLISGSEVNATVDSTANYWAQYYPQGAYDMAVAICAGEDISISDESDITVSVTAVYGTQGIFAYENLSISESTVNAEASGEIAYTISSNKTLEIEDCDSITATAAGGAYAIGVGSTDVTITGSSVNATASTTATTPYVFAAIYAEETGTFTASEIIADGGIYLYSSTGSITATPATGGMLKITRTDDTTTDVSFIDEETVIDTAGYTYVAITAHEHTYDYDSIVWEWAEDYSSVTATATCTDADCDHTETVTVTPTVTEISVITGSTVTYTATVELGGVTFTSTVTKSYVSSQATASADYSAVREAIAKANALNPDDYEDFSAVTRIINSIDWTLTGVNQSAVNAMADAINEAIANLVPVSTEEVVIDEPVEGTDIEIED